MPVQDNLEDANILIVELGTIQKTIKTYVERLKNGMVALKPRSITPSARKKKVARRKEDKRGQKRGASESPKIDGLPNTR